MGNIHNTIASEFSQSLIRLANQSDKLERTLAQTAAAMTVRGFPVTGNVDRIIEDYQSAMHNLNDESHKILNEIEQYQELVRTSALITASLELDQVLEDVMDTVIQLTGAERAYLMLKAKDTEDLIIRAARNWDRETISETDVFFSRGIINAAIEQGQPILTTNAQDDDRFQSMASVVSYSLRSIVVIPIILRDEVLGVMYADNRLTKGVFEEHRLPLLNAFANQTAIAISNARQFEQVKVDLAEAQREVQRLRIKIDQTRLREQVEEITDNDYFQELAKMARQMRDRTDNQS